MRKARLQDLLWILFISDFLVSDKIPTQNFVQISTFSPSTTKAQSTLFTSPRVPTINIIILVLCGLLSKSLVFTVLLAVTQRSFGP
ncbi:triggering receptor expressed on myeloid cells 1 isoform X5 [Mustela putorius furo]|uniref:Triggering receptor expressed on myeloid cells 1 isoform X5 n=1 Tax=Mustela putorius furo TaxID=9669 RepID=A0A8U0USJ5_MUSPF|nr:triggering receptor expressed on myeloid cells 1 isoform X5 [Mustela putorius furo]